MTFIKGDSTGPWALYVGKWRLQWNRHGIQLAANMHKRSFALFRTVWEYPKREKYDPS